MEQFMSDEQIIIPITIGACSGCGKEVVLINGYGICECGYPGALVEQHQYNCYVSDEILDNLGLQRKRKKKGKVVTCWLCGKANPKPDTIITVECEVPGGEPCKPKEVFVHTRC